MKKTIVLILTIAIMMCTFSACGTNPEKEILGKWYNEKGEFIKYTYYGIFYKE